MILSMLFFWVKRTKFLFFHCFECNKSCFAKITNITNSEDLLTQKKKKTNYPFIRPGAWHVLGSLKPKLKHVFPHHVKLYSPNLKKLLQESILLKTHLRPKFWIANRESDALTTRPRFLFSLSLSLSIPLPLSSFPPLPYFPTDFCEYFLLDIEWWQH